MEMPEILTCHNSAPASLSLLHWDESGDTADNSELVDVSTWSRDQFASFWRSVTGIASTAFSSLSKPSQEIHLALTVWDQDGDVVCDHGTNHFLADLSLWLPEHHAQLKQAVRNCEEYYD